MSQRSIRRAQQRRVAADERRAALRRRRAVLATGAALGAAALAAPAAHAATFEVTTTADASTGACDAICTLRDAIAAANANAEADTITFASGVTGTITLALGQLTIDSSYDLTIAGPGAGALAVSGADSSRVFAVADGRATLSGLTIRDGAAATGAGLYATGGEVTVVDTHLTDNHASSSGGAIATRGISLTLTRTQVTGNTAGGGGGVDFLDDGYSSPDTLRIADSDIRDNHAGYSGGGIIANGQAVVSGSTIADNDATRRGGGVFALKGLTLSSSRISGNSAMDGAGGGILAYADRYYGPLNVSDSQIAGNAASEEGGGIDLQGGSYGGGASGIERTTISGNDAGTAGAGIHVDFLVPNDHLTISHTTIAGNDATAGEEPGRGGGVAVDGRVFGRLDLLDSTVSGNTAGAGGGVSLFEDDQPYNLPLRDRTIAFRNSTIASNTALSRGGGIFLGAYDPYHGSAEKSPIVTIQSTIVADNAGDDLDRADDSTSGGFESAFSLVEKPSADAGLTQVPGNAGIVGADPQLGPLVDNGGPTLTHLPARTSPVVDRAHGDPRDTDQRGRPRVVDNEPPNPAEGDGTDIGAVELGAVAFDAPPAGPMKPPPDDDRTPAQNLPPQALIKHNGLRSKKAAKRFVSGVASDDNAVAKVEIALVRKRRGMCRRLLASGRFSRARRCHGPGPFLPAAGTAKWRFDLKQRLDSGYYVVYSRAIDDAGRTQISFGTKSRRPFRVR
jgi:CSLREA domain-containing protein